MEGVPTAANTRTNPRDIYSLCLYHLSQMFAALLTTLFFSMSAVTARRTTRWLAGTEANFWRLLVAAIALAIYAYGFSYGMNRSAFHILFISGCVGFGLGDLALFQAFPRIGSRLTVMIVHCLAAPFAALTEWIWLGTSMTLFEILCAAAILTGVSIALAPKEHQTIRKGDLIPGAAFGVVAAFGQGLGAAQSRIAYEVASQAGENIDGVTVAYQRILGGLLVSGLWLLFINRKHLAGCFHGKRNSKYSAGLPANNKWPALPWVIVNGLSGPTLGVSCYQWALKTTPTGIVLPIVAMTPLVVIPFALAMKEEKPSLRSLLGGVIAVGGVVALALVYSRHE